MGHSQTRTYTQNSDVFSAVPPLLHRGRSLSLRRTAPVDAPLLFEHMYSNASFMHLFRLNDRVEDESQLRDRLARRLTVPPQQSGYLELLAIHKRHGPIGVGVLADYSCLHRRAELLVGLFDETFRQVSYGLEAGFLLADLAFNQYHLHRLYAYSYGHNSNAQHVLSGIGFAPEGVMQEHVFDRDTEAFVDLHVFGLTVRNYRLNQRIARISKRLVGRDITQPLALSPQQQPDKPKPPAFVPSGSIAIGRVQP